MKNRNSIVLDEDEFMNLWNYCLEDLRTPMEELRHLLRLKMYRCRNKQSPEIKDKEENTDEKEI